MYKQIKLNITEAQAKKALNGKSFRVNPAQIGSGSTFVSLHPLNVKAVEKAVLKGSGFTLHLSPGELADTAHRMDGAGFWGNLWGGLKKGWRVLKDTGIATKLADAAVAPLAAYAGPQTAIAGRQLFKAVTGAGVAGVGRMKRAERLAKLRGSGLYLS